MAHKITVAPSSKLDNLPFAMKCSCGTEGDFATKEEARGYAQVHMQNYRLPKEALTVLDKDPAAKAVEVKPAVAEAKPSAPPVPDSKGPVA